jgi:xanthine dehydrogenase small subunit
MVRYFAARQIKHRGTIGGNLCTASPIGDLPPVLHQPRRDGGAALASG